MDPHQPFGHNPSCPARGPVGQGNSRVPSRKERRDEGRTCQRTFAATRGTPFYRLKAGGDVVTRGLTVLSPGGPLQAIVAACGLAERTVAAWQARAGAHGQRGPVDLGHGQADELWGKVVRGKVGLALALAVPSRWWLGGVVSPPRDRALLTALAQRGRACARQRALLVCVDGLAGYVPAFVRGFRHAVRTGRVGRPRLVEEPGLLLGQVIKPYSQRRVVGGTQRVVRGTPAASAAALVATGGGTGSNTADIERLNATFRAALAPLVRRGRALLRREARLTAAVYLVGGADNFCWAHDSRRLAAPAGASPSWQERTPAMAAGLTDHRWSLAERLPDQVPLPVWVAPKRQGCLPRPAQSPPLKRGA